MATGCLSGLLKAEELFQRLQGATSMKDLIAKLNEIVANNQVDSVRKAA